MTDIQTLLDQGYLPIPVKRGDKRPAMGNWQNARLTANDWIAWEGSSIGLLTGQGEHPIVAVDIDTPDPELAAEFESWCEVELGATLIRIGRAPKRLLIYRAGQAGWGKMTGAWFEDLIGERTRVEILGHGQQFVAFGIHPDTKRPYEWTDIFGGPEFLGADDLPVVTVDQLEHALLAFAGMAKARGLDQVSVNQGRIVPEAQRRGEADFLLALEPPVGVPLATLREKLPLLSQRAMEYDYWLKVGMALHHEYEGAAEAMALWDAWSSGAPNYAGSEDIAKRWESFGASGRSPITARWLLAQIKAVEHDAEISERQDLRDRLRRLIEACNDSIRLTDDVAREVSRSTANNQAGVRIELIGVFQARFKELTEGSITKAQVEKLFNAVPAPTSAVTMTPLVKFDARRLPTENGLLERLIERHGAAIRYARRLAAWYHWNGVYWQPATKNDIGYLILQIVRSLPQELAQCTNDMERQSLAKFCIQAQRNYTINQVLDLATKEQRLWVEEDALDREWWALGVQNGVVDLRSGRLLPPDPSLYITRATACDFDAEAECPRFLQMVRDIFFDKDEMVSYMQRLFGYALLGRPDEDIFVIPWGLGCNGKSTLFGAIRDVLGSYARPASADTFTDIGISAGGAARPDLVDLRGARFVYVNESEETGRLRESFVKTMAGGDVLSARPLYGSTITFKPTWLAAMPTNHKPLVQGDDDGIWRRLRLIAFERNFREDLCVEMVPDLDKRLVAEWPGILAWCVRGAMAYQLGGLNDPADVLLQSARHRESMDLLGEWLAECCDRAAEAWAPLAKLWGSWEQFARNRGELRYVASARALARRLESRGFRPGRRAQGSGFVGIDLRAAPDFL